MRASYKLFKSLTDKSNSIIVDTMYVKNLGVTTCLDCKYFVPANQSIYIYLNVQNLANKT